MISLVLIIYIDNWITCCDIIQKLPTGKEDIELEKLSLHRLIEKYYLSVPSLPKSDSAEK